jgi:hypothetical protein
MDTITLQFQTPQDLSGFRKMAGSKVTQVSIKDLTLTCSCSMKDIAHAINVFGAVAIDAIEKKA